METVSALAVFVVFVGGGIGAGLRYLISLAAKKRFGLTHWATFYINIVGCLFLGFVATLIAKHPNLMNQDLYLFLTTGIAGGFTTFSTFSWENVSLLKEGKTTHCIAYMFSSLIVGILGIFIGYSIANFI